MLTSFLPTRTRGPAMKKPLLLLTLLAAATAAQATDTAYTAPVGGMTVNIAAGTPSAPSTTTFAIPLLDEPAATGATRGAVSSFTASTITVSDAGWTSGALVLTGYPYAVRITSGSAAGLTLSVTSNTADTLTISGADLTTAGLAAGDKFRLIPVDTLNTFFGASTLLGGTTPDAADIVTLSSSSQSSFYYNTSLGRWVRTAGSTADRGNTPIPVDSAISITRKSSQMTLTLLGRVPESRAMIAVGNAGSTFTHTGFPTDVTLGSLAIQSKIPGWVSSVSPASADLLGVNSSGVWIYYFHNGTNWQRTSGSAANRDTISIPAGAAVKIFRVGVAGGTSYFTRDLPYSL